MQELAAPTSTYAAITPDEVRVSSQVMPEERIELCDLIHKHRKCFMQNMYELGCIVQATMTIVEKPGSQPVKNAPYRASWHEREVLRPMTDELKRAGLICDSLSEYSSPVLLVRKKAGDYRMVVD